MLKLSIASGESFVQLLVQKIDRVVSDHGGMTSHREQGQVIFARNGVTDYCTLEGSIDHDKASFDHFKSELTCLTPPQCPLTIWSRSGQ